MAIVAAETAYAVPDREQSVDIPTHGDVEISKPEGGLFIWIKLPAGTKTAKLREAVVKAGMR